MRKYIGICLSVFIGGFSKGQTLLPANPIMYEVNVRHHTKEGTIKAFVPHVKELKDLGVNVLWVMPSQPIGKKKRKAMGDVFVEDLVQKEGEMDKWEKYKGSPYAIADYTAVNPDYGTLEDFRLLVKECHQMGIMVILDWVANHTAWDHRWIQEHPEWYMKNAAGEITDPLDKKGKSMGWTDVAKLNYSESALRKEMIASMKFWIDSVDLDGFRCDVAMDVPADFWKEATTELRKVKPVFMLAESEEHDMEQFKGSFNAYYGWEVHHLLNKISQGKETPAALCKQVERKFKKFPKDVFPMNFITNHDENAWNGTEFERMQSLSADAWKAMAVFTYFTPGIPLLYTGQEVGNNKRLAFFEKDTIIASREAASIRKFYVELGRLKHALPETGISKALNQMVSFDVDGKALISWVRETAEADRTQRSRTYIVINMSNNKQKWGKRPKGNIVFTSGVSETTIEPWGYRVIKMPKVSKFKPTITPEF